MSHYIQNHALHSSFVLFSNQCSHVKRWTSTYTQFNLHLPFLACCPCQNTTTPMDLLWGLLRRKVYCGGKPTDVILSDKAPIACIQPTNDQHLTHRRRSWFYDDESGKTILEIGDPSRNVIEMIFRATTIDTRDSIKIKQVLKLKNSWETAERFERFREAVKTRGLDHCNKHPRNMVDGNEQLLFYGIRFTCCKQFETSKLCRDSHCKICRIIQSGFYAAHKKTGIWLSTSCQEFINSNSTAKMTNVKIAIMVCRVIAGRVIDMLDNNFEGDYDSISGLKPNYLFVKNPNAVLPCFVIVLNCGYISYQSV